MVNFAPEHSSEIQQTQVPDFSHGATPHDTAQYFRFIGQPEKAEAAIRGAAGTSDKVFYILTPPWVGGFKEIGKTGVQYVNLGVLNTSFQSEVHTHERIHNAHEGRWGKIDIPWFEYMTPARRTIIFAGMSELSELELIEGLTQYATQNRLDGETQSWYDGFEVPESLRLFRTLGEKSWIPLVGLFLRMALDGATDGKQQFADGVRIGGNIMLLEEALRESVFPEADAQKMSEIIEVQKKNFVVRDIAHAKRLVQSYQKAQVTRLIFFQ